MRRQGFQKVASSALAATIIIFAKSGDATTTTASSLSLSSSSSLSSSTTSSSSSSILNAATDSCLCNSGEPGCEFVASIGSHVACGSLIARPRANGTRCFCDGNCAESRSGCCNDYHQVCVTQPPTSSPSSTPSEVPTTTDITTTQSSTSYVTQSVHQSYWSGNVNSTSVPTTQHQDATQKPSSQSRTTVSVPTTERSSVQQTYTQQVNTTTQTSTTQSSTTQTSIDSGSLYVGTNEKSSSLDVGSWIGIGILILAIGLLLVAYTVRRKKRHQQPTPADPQLSHHSGTIGIEQSGTQDTQSTKEWDEQLAAAMKGKGELQQSVGTEPVQLSKENTQPTLLDRDLEDIDTSIKQAHHTNVYETATGGLFSKTENNGLAYTVPPYLSATTTHELQGNVYGIQETAATRDYKGLPVIATMQSPIYDAIRFVGEPSASSIAGTKTSASLAARRDQKDLSIRSLNDRKEVQNEFPEPNSPGSPRQMSEV